MAMISSSMHAHDWEHTPVALYSGAAGYPGACAGVGQLSQHADAAGTFGFGTRDVRGVPLRVFTSLPPALGTYYSTWFEQFAEARRARTTN